MERKTTGGTKEFQYTKEDMERIRRTDTESTRAFKESYAKWQEQRRQDRILEEEMRKKRRNLLLLVIMLLFFVVLLLVLQYW